MSRMKRWSLLALSAFASVACKAAQDSGGEPSARSTDAGRPPAAGRVALIEAPAGPVGPIVRASAENAARENRKLVVYVGAGWCEPCQRFHLAAARGELDGALAGVALLEFDLDRDGERLASAGYLSKYIPLFALPSPDGSASGKQVEGGIKGEGAVGFILPRLQALLAR